MMSHRTPNIRYDTKSARCIFRFCATGALQTSDSWRVGGLMKTTAEKQSYKVAINTAWCKACGICIEFCPKKALGRDSDEKAVWEHPETCIRCCQCAERCPDLAIELVQGEE